MQFAPWNVCQVFAVSCIVWLANNKSGGWGVEGRSFPSRKTRLKERKEKENEED